MEWALRQKTKFILLSQRFGELVEKLRALVPPENMSQEITVMKRTRTGFDLHLDGASRQRDRQTGHMSSLDSHFIMMELEKQAERRWPQSPS